MKNPERVAQLLAELRDLAVNDFERHRIDVLERDLTEPPAVEHIDDTHQKFCNFIFRKQKSGHYVENLPLHRAVWSYYNGEIPAGCQIHHIDENPENNSIENLQCLTVAEHRRLHNQLQIGIRRVCPTCGEEFSPPQNGHRCGRFCSFTCASKYYADNHPVIRNCAWCGEEFTCNPGIPTLCCSHNCAAKLWHSKKVKQDVPIKYCGYCGKPLPPDKRHPCRKYCSLSCSKSAFWEKRKLLEQRR